MARLVHLNGAPGVGKSTIARRFLGDHRLAFLIDIDEIRIALGSWEQIDESKAVARRLALALANEHLSSGFDVVIPQYVGQPEFIATLERAAIEAGATFVEVVLKAPEAVAAERFRGRRRELVASGVRHPQAEVPDVAVQATVHDAATSLQALIIELGDVVEINADQQVDVVYAALQDALQQRKR